MYIQYTCRYTQSDMLIVLLEWHVYTHFSGFHAHSDRGFIVHYIDTVSVREWKHYL